jgi:flagella basal body P-ring formation protein FlgA
MSKTGLLLILLIAYGCIINMQAAVASSSELEQHLSTRIHSLIEQTVRYRYPQQYQLDVSIRFSKAIHQIQPCSKPVAIHHRSEIKLGKQKWTLRCEAQRWSLSATSSASLTIWAVTADKALRKGQRLSPSDIAIKPITLYTDKKVFFKPSEVVGSKLKRSVNKGELLTISRLYLDYDVEKGQAVDVLYQSETIRLETLGTALESGLVGDTVSVQNQQSGKLLRGVVIKKNQVRVY